MKIFKKLLKVFFIGSFASSFSAERHQIVLTEKNQVRNEANQIKEELINLNREKYSISALRTDLRKLEEFVIKCKKDKELEIIMNGFLAIQLSLFDYNLRSFLLNKKEHHIVISKNILQQLDNYKEEKKLSIDTYVFLKKLLKYQKTIIQFITDNNYNQETLFKLLAANKNQIQAFKEDPFYEEIVFIFESIINKITDHISFTGNKPINLLLKAYDDKLGTVYQSNLETLIVYNSIVNAPGNYPDLFPSYQLDGHTVYKFSNSLSKIYSLCAEKLMKSGFFFGVINNSKDIDFFINFFINKDFFKEKAEKEEAQKLKLAEERAEKAGNALLSQLGKKKKKEKKPSEVACAAPLPKESEKEEVLLEVQEALGELEVTEKEIIKEAIPVEYTATINNWFKNPDHVIAAYHYADGQLFTDPEIQSRQAIYKKLKKEKGHDEAVTEIIENHTIPFEVDQYVLQREPIKNKTKKHYSLSVPLLKKRKGGQDFVAGNFEIAFNKKDQIKSIFHRLFRPTKKSAAINSEVITAVHVEKELEEKDETYQQDDEGWIPVGVAIDDSNPAYTKFDDNRFEYYLLKY